MTADPAALRLALRREGTMWNAYIAKQNTMQGAILIGSIVMSAVTDNGSCKSAFMALMQSAMADVIRAQFGAAVEWPSAPEPAPEHERGGSA